jgi:hypothetical protein
MTYPIIFLEKLKRASTTDTLTVIEKKNLPKGGAKRHGYANALGSKHS